MEGEDTANTKMRKSVLAELLQTPKWGKASLQESCKDQNGEKRPCRSPANAKMGKSAFAETLQSPETSSKCLRGPRKSLEKLFGVCGSPASPTENFLVFAGVPQVPREMLWRLRESRKSHGKLFGLCGSPASLLVWRKPKEGSGKNDRVLGDKCIGSNGFASAKKRQSVGIDEDGA